MTMCVEVPVLDEIVMHVCERLPQLNLQTCKQIVAAYSAR